MGQRAKHIFNILANGVSSEKADNRSQEINYRLLTEGSVDEIRFVLGEIILSTLVQDKKLAERAVTKAEKDDIQVMNPPQKLKVLEQFRHTSVHPRKLHSTGKNKNKRSITPSNYEELPDNATKRRLFEDNSIVTDHRSSGKLRSESFDLCSHSLDPDKIMKDEHVKAEIHHNKSVLSSLFR